MEASGTPTSVGRTQRKTYSGCMLLPIDVGVTLMNCRRVAGAHEQNFLTLIARAVFILRVMSRWRVSGLLCLLVLCSSGTARAATFIFQTVASADQIGVGDTLLYTTIVTNNV